MWWPSSTDPFYLANTSENTARKDYYGVTGTPTMECDGSTASWPSIQSTIQARMAVASPLWMDLILVVNGNTLNVTVKAVADNSVTGNNVLHVVLLDRYSYLPASPNGQPHHYHSMLDMAPSASGQAFTATANDTVTYTASHTLNPSWNIANLDVAAFVQNNNNREVLQAHCEPVPVDFPGLTYQSHSIEDEDNDGRVEPGESASMFVTLGNGQAFEPATNVVATLSATDPTIVITTATVSYPNIPNGGTGTNSSPFLFEVIPSATPHTSNLHLHVVADPLQTTYDVDLPIFIGWPYVLLINDDGGQSTGMEAYYISTLQAMNEAYEFWNISTQGVPTLAQVQTYGCLIWFTAYSYTNVLTIAEQTFIQNYLNQGGRLFINGQNLSWGLSEQAPTFLSQVLHASFLTFNTNIRLLDGVAGNPVGEDMSLNLNSGGSGSGSASAPDGIAVLPPAQEAFAYQGSATYKGGLTYEDEPTGHRLVFFTFPFEAVNGVTPSNTREEALGQILDFFRAGPALALSEFTLDFDSVLVNTSAQLPLTIYSVGTEMLVLTSITNSLAVFTHNFDPADSLLAPGDSLEITITFAPTDTILYEDVLTITSNSAPSEVPLVGQGLPAAGNISDHSAAVVREFAVRNAYPNPFNPITAISYQLSANSYISLKVFDAAGRLVADLVNGWREAGSHELTFDGSGLPSGIYFAKLEAGDFSQVQKLVLMK